MCYAKRCSCDRKIACIIQSSLKYLLVNILVIVAFYVVCYMRAGESLDAIDIYKQINIVLPPQSHQPRGRVLSFRSQSSSDANSDTTYKPLDKDCDFFIQYNSLRTPTASSFINGLFEFYFKSLSYGHSFSHNKCVRASDTVPLRVIEISKYPFNYAHNRHPIYMDTNREGCGTLYDDPIPLNYTIIAYNYYNSKIYNQRRAMRQVYMPLFFRYDFGDYTRDIHPLLHDYRTNSVVFNKRPLLLSVAMSTVTGYRSNYTHIFDKIGEIYQDRVFLRLIDEWHERNEGYHRTDKNSARYLVGAKYRKLLIHTKFMVCMDGNNPETFRIAESLAMGTIPIIAIRTSEYRNHACSDALDPLVLHGSSYNQWDINIDPQFNERSIVFSRKDFVRNWHYYDGDNGFDAHKLNQLYEMNSFAPFIVLADWDDLETFIAFVHSHRHNKKAIAFWNTFQKYLNIWFSNWLQSKQHELADVIIQHLYHSQY